MKRKSPLLTVSFLGALFLLPYCDDDPPDEVGFRYPLAIGNTWDYTRRWDLFHYTDSTASTYDDTTTMLFDIQVAVIDMASLGGLSGLYRIISTESSVWDTIQGAHYYGQDEEGLYLYGYEGYGGLSMPKVRPASVSRSGILFNGRYFSNVNQLFQIIQDALPGHFPLVGDTTEPYIEDPPLVVLQYPLDQDTTWTYRYAYDPWRIDKVVIGEEEITVPAGAFECMKVKWLYDIDNDGEWDSDLFIEDYIGDVGLVKREITILGIISINELGEIVGYMDSMGRYTLEAVSLE